MQVVLSAVSLLLQEGRDRRRAGGDRAAGAGGKGCGWEHQIRRALRSEVSAPRRGHGAAGMELTMRRRVGRSQSGADLENISLNSLL